jgi:hypothetical protein
MRTAHTHPLVHEERGIALIAALMIMLLMSALMIGFTVVVMSDQRYRGIDKDRNRAYYGAQSGLEKLTTDFGNLYLTNVSPTAAQIDALKNTPPTIPGVTFVAPWDPSPAGQLVAYGVTSAKIPCPQDDGTTLLLDTCNMQIGNGPYEGLMALKKQYNLSAVAVTGGHGEVHLTRSIESVAIPVFQFGMFSDVDLSFFAGPAFNFGGRVHTNGNLFLAEGGGNTLTLTDKVTAVGDIIRQRMQNGVLLTTSPTHDGTISMATAPNTFRNLLQTEGSLMDGLGSSPNPGWHSISIGAYNGYIRNGGCPTPTTCSVPPRGTGAKPLNLALLTVGGTNSDLTRRPQKNEDTNNNVLFGERMFAKKEGMSLRILLSDTPTNITNLPSIDTTKQPIPLGEVLGVAPDWKTAVPAGFGLTAVDATHAPIARSPGEFPAGFKTAGTSNGTGDTNLVYAAGTLPTAAAGYQLHAPTLVTTVVKGGVTQYMVCTGVTTTQLTNCTPTTSVGVAGPNWQTASGNESATVVVNNVAYSSNLVESIPNGTALAKIFTVTGGTAPYAGTAPWGLNTFWVQAKDNAQFTAGTPNVNYDLYPTLVTCTGVDTPNSRFTGCNGSPNGNWLPKTASNTPIYTNAMSARNTGLVGGYIKIEIQKADNSWVDVTAEILNYGIAGPSQLPGTDCYSTANPSTKAILRLQRLRDTPRACTTPGSQDSYDYWPNALFDTREGLLRDVDPNDGRPTLGGLMNYVELDAKNLSLWFKCAAPYNAGVCSGTQVITNNGYSVYFSDRRGNVNPGPFSTPANPANVDGANLESGEYGFEDFVNPTTAAGTPSSSLDGGEDVNANGQLETYGEFPTSVNALGVAVTNSLPAAGTGLYAPANINGVVLNATTVRPWNSVNYAQGMVNRTYLFRRALKLIHGSLGNIVTPGLTVVTENPVYIQGDWNADQTSTLTNYGDPHAETSVIADAVTLLSNEWTDVESFWNPYNPGNFNGGNRTRNTSWYRLAIIAGKGMAFPLPSVGNPPNDFGTDGGAHNFLRYLESGGTVNYQGAIATFYYNRQAVGTYKCCSTVYGAPTRNYTFDTDFLDPATLPPLTPVFRDINSLGFAQEIRPGK